MNWENVDTNAMQLITQLLHLRMQIVNQAIPNADPKELLGAIDDYINQIGKELEQQAT